jgi:hypothetical protein
VLAALTRDRRHRASSLVRVAAIVAVLSGMGSCVTPRHVDSIRGSADGLHWRFDTFGRSCRRIIFDTPLEPLKGYESNVHHTECGQAVNLFVGGGDPMTVLAIGRSGKRVVVAIDAATQIKTIGTDREPRALRPSRGTVFVYIGSSLPTRFRFAAGGWNGECHFDRQGLPNWWLNCTGNAPGPLPAEQP